MNYQQGDIVVQKTQPMTLWRVVAIRDFAVFLDFYGGRHPDDQTRWVSTNSNLIGRQWASRHDVHLAPEMLVLAVNALGSTRLFE